MSLTTKLSLPVVLTRNLTILVQSDWSSDMIAIFGLLLMQAVFDSQIAASKLFDTFKVDACLL